MTTRTTQKDLDGLVARLNRITNSPATYSTVSHNIISGKADYVINIGHYHLDQAYGGIKLVRTVSEGGGITYPIYMGYETKRVCYGKIAAFIAGIESTQTV